MTVKTYLQIAAFDFIDWQKGDVISSSSRDLNEYSGIRDNERVFVVGVDGMTHEESQALTQPRFKIIDGEYFELLKRMNAIDISTLSDGGSISKDALMLIVSEKIYNGDL